MANTTPQPEQDPLQPVGLIGRDEMNLAEFPIALLADRVPKDQKTIHFEDKHGRLTVTASDAYGLPNATDTDVIVALIYLTKLKNDFRDGKVYFSRYELINLLNWQNDGWSYKRLDEAFNRWGGVLLVYEKCWWNNKLKRYTSAKMHIIETVEIVDHDAGGKADHAGPGGSPLSYFTWNPKFIESCQADNLRELDLDEYFSLKSAVAKRLYRFLGKRFYLRDDWTFDLREIAFERVGLSRNYADAYKIKEKLQPAIEELEAIGFLRPLGRDDRYHRVDRGQWTVQFARHPDALVAPPLGEPEPPPLVAELTKRGVTRATADELVQRRPAEPIAAKIEIFDWLMEKQDKRVAKSPAGYLVKSVLDDYAAPKGFVSKAERRRRDEARQAEDRQAAEERRRKLGRDASERRLRKLAENRLAAMTPGELAELDAESKAAAAPDALAGESGPFGETVKRLRRIEHIQQTLRDQEIRPQPQAARGGLRGVEGP